MNFLLSEAEALTVKDYFLFLGPLAGVVIGGLITSVVKYIELTYNRKRAKEDLLIAKLEDLSARLMMLSKTVVTFGVYLAQALKTGEAMESYRLTSEMHSLEVANSLSAYFPSHRKQANDIISAHTKLLTLEHQLALLKSYEPNDAEYDLTKIEELNAKKPELMDPLIEKITVLRQAVNSEIGRLLKLDSRK